MKLKKGVFKNAEVITSKTITPTKRLNNLYFKDGESPNSGGVQQSR